MELSRWSGDDYINEGVLRAIDVALEITGADKANTLGFSCPCSGPALRHDTRKTVWFANVRAWPVRVYRHNAHQTKRKRALGSKTVAELHIHPDKYGNVTVVTRRPRSKKRIAQRVRIGAFLAGAP